MYKNLPFIDSARSSMQLCTQVDTWYDIFTSMQFNVDRMTDNFMAKTMFDVRFFAMRSNKYKRRRYVRPIN